MLKKLTEIYDKDYKKLLLIPMILYILLFGVIGYHYLKTGELFRKDISLTGGVSVTIMTQKQIDLLELEESISKEVNADVSVRTITQGGRQTGIIIDATISGEKSDALIGAIESHLGKLSKDDYSVQVMGSALGGSFFREAILVVFISFIFMGITVLIYFRVWAPSLFVILSALFDIIGPFAVLVGMNVKISTAGIAAFLMLIGYSVDTDILLTTRVLRGREGSVFLRTIGALKTGVTISITLFSASLIGFIFSQSEVVKQIMLILFMGALFDILNTWITNAAILRWYLEARGKK